MNPRWPNATIAAVCIGVGACAAPAGPVPAHPSLAHPADPAPAPCQTDRHGVSYPSLQAAVNAAEAGDTVVACDLPDGHPGPLVVRRSVRLVGPAELHGGPGPALHVLGGHVVMQQLHLVGGTGAIEPRLGGDTFGGVVAAWDADSLTITSSTVSGGQADWGGCIAGPRNGPLVLTQSTVSDCTGTKVGGGVWVRHGSIEASTITGSTAPYGGGVAIRSVDAANGGVSLAGTTVSDCDGEVQGGGLLVSGPAFVVGGTFEQNTSAQGAGALLSGASGRWSGGRVVANTASVGGGGVFVSGGRPTLAGLEISGNTASGSALADGRGVGGGLWVSGDATTTVHLEDGLLEGNFAAWGGGIIAAGAASAESGPWLWWDGGTLVDNTAETGGGAAASGANLVFDNTVVSTNLAESGGGVHLTDSRLWARGAWGENTPTDIAIAAGTAPGPDVDWLFCDDAGCIEDVDGPSE